MTLKKPTLGFIGIGLMGKPMTLRLLNAGFSVNVWNRSPEKLSPDAVRNTNLQIAHQLRHRADREAIAAAMIMDETQQEYLGKLGVGAAAVFVTGYDRATFIQIPNYKLTTII